MTTRKGNESIIQKENCFVEEMKDRVINFCIEQYKNKIRKGPCYVCCVCIGLLCKRSFHIFGKSKYSCQNVFSVQSSFDGKQ